MRRTAVLAVAGAALLLCGGCASVPSAAPAAKWSAVPHAERYPFSEIEKVYDTVLTSMLPRYFGDDHDLARQHQKPMEEDAACNDPADGGQRGPPVILL